MQTNKKEVKKAASTASKAKASASVDELLKDVRPYDILCGRNKACFNNIGNRRFRITIGMNVKKYDALSNRTERGKFIVELTRTLREEAGYRFFRISKKTGKVELSDDEVRAKIGHALRDSSITLANAAEAAAEAAAAKAAAKEEANDEESKESTEETKTFTEETTTQDAKVISPDVPMRRVTNDFHTDNNGKLLGMPHCPDLQRDEDMDTSDSSQDLIPESIYFAPQHDSLPRFEETPQPPKMTTEYKGLFGKPVQIDDSSSESSVHKDNEADSVDYHLMNLDFTDSDDTDMLEPIPLDMLPTYYANAYMGEPSTKLSTAISIVQSPLHMDHGDVSVESADDKDEMCKKILKMQGFKSFRPRKHEIKQDTMSVGSADGHLIGSGFLELDLPIHA